MDELKYVLWSETSPLSTRWLLQISSTFFFFCLSSNSTNNFNFLDYAIKYSSKRYWNTLLTERCYIILWQLKLTNKKLHTLEYAPLHSVRGFHLSIHNTIQSPRATQTHIPTLKWWVSALQISPWLLKFRVPFPNFTSKSFSDFCSTLYIHTNQDHGILLDGVSSDVGKTGMLNTVRDLLHALQHQSLVHGSSILEGFTSYYLNLFLIFFVCLLKS